jgi:hypothetical protein
VTVEGKILVAKQYFIADVKKLLMVANGGSEALAVDVHHFL